MHILPAAAVALRQYAHPMSDASDRLYQARVPGDEYEVTPLELFFDLVFVFAVSQLSHLWLERMTWRGAVEAVVLLLPVLGVWSYTSWAATMIPADRLATKWMMLSVMALGLFMNASLTGAFTRSGWPFAVPFLSIQLGRTVWTIANAPDAMYREHFVRVLIWLIATTPFWLAGAAAGPDDRVLWWSLAAAIDLLGTWLAHPIPGRRLRSEDVEFSGRHMLERCRLFLLIALGETVLTTGMAISAAPAAPMTVITATSALAGTVALWALYFGRSEPLAIQHVLRTSNPIRDSRFAMNGLTPIVAGLIAVAVGNEHAIAHPDERTSAVLSASLFGGPALFLLAQAWYLRTVPRVSPRAQVIGSIALVALGSAALTVDAHVALTIAALCLVIVAIFDRR
jgi:low temperature requirement protein LtrA